MSLFYLQTYNIDLVEKQISKIRKLEAEIEHLNAINEDIEDQLKEGEQQIEQQLEVQREQVQQMEELQKQLSVS